MRMSAMIKIENVSKVYGKGKKNQVQALKSIDLELEQGHNYAIIGKSGSGKSTLMNMTTGEISQYGGRVCISGF